nr:hypothetical protein [Ureaplasma urealyticum]
MKKRVNKIYKHRMFILLATLNLVWAGVITGIVLRLKSKDYSKHTILKEYYSFDKNGNLILKGYLKHMIILIMFLEFLVMKAIKNIKFKHLLMIKKNLNLTPNYYH